MLRKISSLNNLRTFEVAARRTSFTKAAEELNITQGAVSYQIRQLELQIGTKLFHRETRKVSLTDAGERLYAVTRRALMDIDMEIRALTPDQKAAQLTIAVSTYFAIKWLSPRLGGFLGAFPESSLQLLHTVNDVDFDIGMCDFAIRWGRAPWTGLTSYELLPMRMIPMCAPALVGTGGLGSPADLRNVVLLRDRENVDLWPAWLERAGVAPDSAGKGRTIIDPVVRIQAAMDGQGVVLGDDLAGDEIASGRLVVPFAAALDGYGYHLLWSKHAELRGVAADFRKWIQDQAQSANAR